MLTRKSGYFLVQERLNLKNLRTKNIHTEWRWYNVKNLKSMFWIRDGSGLFHRSTASNNNEYLKIFYGILINTPHHKRNRLGPSRPNFNCAISKIVERSNFFQILKWSFTYIKSCMRTPSSLNHTWKIDLWPLETEILKIKAILPKKCRIKWK